MKAKIHRLNNEQEYRFDRIIKRIEGIEKEIKLLYTSGIVQVLSSSQNTIKTTSTAMNQRSAVIKGSGMNQRSALIEGSAMNQRSALIEGSAIIEGRAMNQRSAITKGSAVSHGHAINQPMTPAVEEPLYSDFIDQGSSTVEESVIIEESTAIDEHATNHREQFAIYSM